MPMNPDLRLRWAAALRSGKYAQGHGYLCSISYPNKYCCLGVLAKLENLFSSTLAPSSALALQLKPPYNTTRALPEALCGELGLSDEAQQCLIQANDIDGWAFNEIADALEAGIIKGVEI